MGQIITAFACADLNKEEKNSFQEIEWIDDIYKADIIIGNPKVYDIHPKFIQLESAGYEQYENKFACPVCNASKSFGLGISEYLICTILMSLRHMKAHMHSQDQRKWNRFDDTIQSISGSCILILGLGDLGSTFAKKAKALGAYTIGVRKSKKDCDIVDEVYTIDSLNKVLPRADIIVCTLPSTKDTRYLLNEEHFHLMKKSVLFCNVGRGDLVKRNILEKVMHEKIIQGMVLDVIENEPLDPGSSLWLDPNVIITPHVSGTFQLAKAKEIFLDIARQNVHAFIHDKPLINQISSSIQ